MITYRNITIEEISPKLLDHFQRKQIVNEVWRKIDNKWLIKKEPFIDEWSLEERNTMLKDMRNFVQDGFVYGAYFNESLKGFVVVNPTPFYLEEQYLDLAYLYVSKDMRGLGIGRTLFYEAVHFAKTKKVDKLYISAHSAVESIHFYHSVGCVEAAVYSQKHVELEPFDYQMEYSLTLYPNKN